MAIMRYTREDVLQLIREAIEFHIDGLKEDGLHVPTPSSEGGVRRSRVRVTSASSRWPSAAADTGLGRLAAKVRS